MEEPSKPISLLFFLLKKLVWDICEPKYYGFGLARESWKVELVGLSQAEWKFIMGKKQICLK